MGQSRILTPSLLLGLNISSADDLHHKTKHYTIRTGRDSSRFTDLLSSATVMDEVVVGVVRHVIRPRETRMINEGGERSMGDIR